ncbi:Uncharacterised protein [Bordetella pertussis]|nr:Uncharacterised protein [Bordetella pertussis]
MIDAQPIDQARAVQRQGQCMHGVEYLGPFDPYHARR